MYIEDGRCHSCLTQHAVNLSPVMRLMFEEVGQKRMPRVFEHPAFVFYMNDFSLEEIGIEPLNKLANLIVLRETGRLQCIEFTNSVGIRLYAASKLGHPDAAANENLV